MVPNPQPAGRGSPDDDADVIIVGSGAAGVACAIVSANEGLRVLVLEKSCYLGGTTALSGGGVWVPANSLMRAAGQSDTSKSALSYLQAVAGEALDKAAVTNFLARGPEALDYLCRHSELAFATRLRSPDYYSEIPGATETSRALDTVPFDGRRLGEDLRFLRPPRSEMLLFGAMAVNAVDIAHLRDAFVSMRSLRHSINRLAGFVWRRLRYGRDTRLVMGQAMIGRMLASARKLGIKVIREASATALLRDGDRVVGVRVALPDGARTFRACRGVVLATGGFACNKDMLDHWVPDAAQHVAVGARENTGDGIAMAVEAGGVLAATKRDSAYWVPVSTRREPSGPAVAFPHLVSDRAKPGIIAVNRVGERFVNEADSYHDFVRAMHAQAIADPAQRFFLICDGRAIRRFGLGHVRPWPFPRRQFVRDGYLLTGATVVKLAIKLDLPPDRLARTIAHHNDAAQAGRDALFARGRSDYNRSMGDPANKPNPCLGPINVAPFYAVELFPGILSTSRGLETNHAGNVVDGRGQVIDGLYAVGADANAVFGGAYPGPGASLGPGLTSGYLAGLDLARGGSAAVPDDGDACGLAR